MKTNQYKSVTVSVIVENKSNFELFRVCASELQLTVGDFLDFSWCWVDLAETWSILGEI